MHCNNGYSWLTAEGFDQQMIGILIFQVEWLGNWINFNFTNMQREEDNTKKQEMKTFFYIDPCDVNWASESKQTPTTRRRWREEHVLYNTPFSREKEYEGWWERMKEGFSQSDWGGL